MRELKHKDGNIYSIVTHTRDLTHRISNYGESKGYWKIVSHIERMNEVFSVDVVVTKDIEKICSELKIVT